jgi:hypothetical protein
MTIRDEPRSEGRNFLHFVPLIRKMRRRGARVTSDLIRQLRSGVSDDVMPRLARMVASTHRAGDIANLACDESEPLSLRWGLACALAVRYQEHPEDQEACLRVLRTMARSPDAGVRVAVAEALGSIRAGGDVLRTLQRDPHPSVRVAAEEAADPA